MVQLVEIKPEQMDSWTKQESLELLDELRTMIEEGKISGWCYVAVNATMVFNAGSGMHNDPYRIAALLEQTKLAILNDLLYGEDDDE